MMGYVDHDISLPDLALMLYTSHSNVRLYLLLPPSPFPLPFLHSALLVLETFTLIHHQNYSSPLALCELFS